MQNQLNLRLASSSCRTLLAMETTEAAPSVVENCGPIFLSKVYGTTEVYVCGIKSVYMVENIVIEKNSIYCFFFISYNLLLLNL